MKTALTLIRRERSALESVHAAFAPPRLLPSAENARWLQLGEMERTGTEIERLSKARRNP